MVVVDSQLQWVLELFNGHGLPYWLNSGTLLGLMREGKLLAHDQDIDISIWAEHETGLNRLLPQFKKAGYRVLSARYRGLPFQYQFTPKGGAEQRSIDINLFRRSGEHAWCPEYYFRVQPGRSGTGPRSGAGAVRGVMRFCWRQFIARVPLRVSISSWPWRFFVNQATWWIPALYFDRLEFNEGLGAYIPADWAEYLELRYGDWTVPRQDWVFHRDDRGIITSPPDLVLHRHAEGKALT